MGIDVILAHRLLKNEVTIPEYVLLTDDLVGTDHASLPETVQEISPDLEGIGRIRAHYVDVASLDQSAVPRHRPTVGSRLGSTFSAVGRGLPYMLGMKKPRVAR